MAQSNNSGTFVFTFSMISKCKTQDWSIRTSVSSRTRRQSTFTEVSLQLFVRMFRNIHLNTIAYPLISKKPSKSVWARFQKSESARQNVPRCLLPCTYNLPLHPDRNQMNSIYTLTLILYIIYFILSSQVSHETSNVLGSLSNFFLVFLTFVTCLMYMPWTLSSSLLWLLVRKHLTGPSILLMYHTLSNFVLLFW